MPDERGILREIAWREVFPWVSIVRCARLALSPRLVALAALGLFATAIGWRSIGELYPDSVIEIGWIQQDRAWPWESQLTTVPQLEFSRFNPIVSPVLETGRRLCEPFRR